MSVQGRFADLESRSLCQQLPQSCGKFRRTGNPGGGGAGDVCPPGLGGPRAEGKMRSHATIPLLNLAVFFTECCLSSRPPAGVLRLESSEVRAGVERCQTAEEQGQLTRMGWAHSGQGVGRRILTGLEMEGAASGTDHLHSPPTIGPSLQLCSAPCPTPLS